MQYIPEKSFQLVRFYGWYSNYSGPQISDRSSIPGAGILDAQSSQHRRYIPQTRKANGRRDPFPQAQRSGSPDPRCLRSPSGAGGFAIFIFFQNQF